MGSSWWLRPEPCDHREILTRLEAIQVSLADLHRKADAIMTANDDLTTAVTGLGAEITTFLNDLAGQVAGGLTADQAEAVVAQINGFTAQLAAADPATAAAPPASDTPDAGTTPPVSG